MKEEYLTKEGCREVELNILSTIAKICDENNLKYFMCGGTMLGAIRHKGFIPWDDDIDIMLLRNDYERLISILKKQKEYPWLQLLDSTVDGYYYTFAKAIDNTTCAKMEDNVTDHGLWVDIFPYDNYPDNDKKRKRFILKGYFYRSVVMSMTTDFSASIIKNRKIKKILYLYSKLINKKKFIAKYERFCKKYSKNVNSKYVGCLFSPYKFKECFEREWFNEQKEYDFEKYKFKGPLNYDSFLTKLYGNYMELPPEDKRRDHKIIAWKKKDGE